MAKKMTSEKQAELAILAAVTAHPGVFTTGRVVAFCEGSDGARVPADLQSSEHHGNGKGLPWKALNGAVHELIRRGVIVQEGVTGPLSLGAVQKVEAATKRAAGEAVAGPVLTRLPMAAIAPDPEQPRKRFNQQELRELSRSMEAQGLLQPITVREVEAGRYLIVTGERRYRAAQLAGWADIPAIVDATVDRATTTIRQVIENLNRLDMTPIEEARACRVLVDTGLDTNAVGRELGKSGQWVERRLSLLTLDDRLVDLIDRGTMPPSQGEAIANLSADGKRAFMVQMLKHDPEKDGELTLKKVRDMCNAIEQQESLSHMQTLGLAILPPTKKQQQKRQDLDAALKAIAKMVKKVTDPDTLEILPTLPGLKGKDAELVRMLIRELGKLEKALSTGEQMKDAGKALKEARKGKVG